MKVALSIRRFRIKKQTLLRLQSEIERSQAKLAEIQNTLNQNN